ncbi:gluconokinase [Pectinatus haikarae]|uniref:Gluconokinase n=1 Tax=Pectinatus haikarae TaxID=349096 RepID=A0ABT9YAX8_9FIRM|nr:gluconokinase [Pectinatus haikarae]MDQ0204269.1 gluconokinase [Pectinatus haikarae]
MKKDPPDQVWIGVDIGTTGVRAIAYMADSTNIGSSEAFYPLLTPRPDWAEESPLQIYEAVQEVIKNTADQLRYKNIKASGIALSTVMHSFAGLDEAKKPLMNMQTWADSRSLNIVRELKKDTELSRDFYNRTCCPIHACYPLAKILWLRKYAEDIFKKTKYIGSLKDYIFYNLTGEWVIDHSTASTSGMYNAKKMDWDDEILRYAGVKKTALPAIVSTTYHSFLSRRAAEFLHLQSGMPVVIGATDGVLVNVGIGAVNPGQLSATIGTSGALRMLTTKPMVDKHMRTWCYNLTDEMWVAGGAINNGGMILRWLRDKVCHYSKNQMENIDVDPYDLMTLKAGHVAPGSEGLILMPFFTGERAPYWNSELRGIFFGLSLNHGRSHMIRAAMEGICYCLNSVFMALQDFGNIKDIRVSGSFTKSPLWLQILADVLDQKLILPGNSEGAAFGAAVLGFISDGTLKNINETAALVNSKKIFAPIAENTEVYKRLYDIFSRLYFNLQDEFADIVSYQTKLH